MRALYDQRGRSIWLFAECRPTSKVSNTPPSTEAAVPHDITPVEPAVPTEETPAEPAVPNETPAEPAVPNEETPVEPAVPSPVTPVPVPGQTYSTPVSVPLPSASRQHPVPANTVPSAGVLMCTCLRAHPHVQSNPTCLTVILYSLQVLLYKQFATLCSQSVSLLQCPIFHQSRYTKLDTATVGGVHGSGNKERVRTTVLLVSVLV